MRLPLRALAALLVPTVTTPLFAAEPGLLFHLSGDRGTTADFSAAGRPTPTYEAEISTIPDGAHGGALRCGDKQTLAYRAPGNIHAQRGTLAFFWRSRYPVGPTAFPLFRVGYADHSSWDMVWLRIDYNGHGLDAFVTDASLSRVRVSADVQPFPAPNTWMHVAFTWDETRGVRLFVNGSLAAQAAAKVRLDAALDQFGPHSRIISPYQVQSDYNFVRGGDLDELRIYDHALDDATIARVAKGESANTLVAAVPSWDDAAIRAAWLARYGFDQAGGVPLLPEARSIAIRKVEIHDAFDLKRWWWKATDGIRETTWPGVYNRSRLPGRNDYFQLPDWDCYVESGRALDLTLPAESWNHLEISGAAWGHMTDEKGAALFDRERGHERTLHRLATPRTGGKLTFTNVEAEQPIGELAVFNVTAGRAPAGSHSLAFQVVASDASLSEPARANVAPLRTWLEGRFGPGERTLLYGRPQEESGAAPAAIAAPPSATTLPIRHMLIPNTWDQLTDGLDGIEIELPAQAKNSASRAFNLQVRDPLWPLRTLADFTFAVPTGSPRTLWFDLRDRLLPPGRPFGLTLAADAPELTLEGAVVRLVFKPRAAARPEHELDRFTQARDSYAMLVEEHPANPRLDLWNRFKGDLEDLLRVNPDHLRGREYAAAGLPGSARPHYEHPAPIAGVPLWAQRQVELLGHTKRFVLWYIDHRQVPYGDLGGGISDDTDLTNLWPGLALMGAEPAKIRDSLRTLLNAAYRNGLFTRGLSTIQTDELHSYEEGINCLAQNLITDFGSPRQLERAMETARGVESITGVNAAGHRHIRSSYYSGSKIATEDPWGYAKPYSYLVMQVPQLLVEFNGSPAARKYLLELADGLLAHRHANGGGSGRLFSVPAIHFATDREESAGRSYFPWHVFWGAYRWTGDRRYLEPIISGGGSQLMQVNANVMDQLEVRETFQRTLRTGDDRPADNRPGGRAANFRASAFDHFAWQLDHDKSRLARLYTTQIETCAATEFINTEGSLWIDRVGVPTAELQRARLGGAALVRNSLYPGHTVGWSFAAPANEQSVAILIPDATRTRFTVIACNVETRPVAATMTGWELDPGQWEITQGVDTNDDDRADGPVTTRTARFERSRSLTFELPPRATTILTLKLKQPGTPYWQRPDLGLDREDVTVQGNQVRVRLHSLGGVAVPASTVAVIDAQDRTLAHANTPAMNAPDDLTPHTAEVTLTLPNGANLSGAAVLLDPDEKLEEVTRLNNRVELPRSERR